MATVPGTPSTLSGLDVTALRKIAWMEKYRTDSVRPSIFTALKTDFSFAGNEIMIKKNGILLDVSTYGAKERSQSIRCAMRLPLDKAPYEGTSESMLGNEDETGLRYVELYYNEIKKSIKYNTYGYDYNDTEYLAYNEGYSALMGQYWAELNDYRFQQALLLGYSNELTKAPLQNTCIQFFNKNFAVPNLAPSRYPEWDVDTITVTDGVADAKGYYSSRYYSGVAAYTEDIGDKLMEAATFAATPTATLTVDSIYQIAAYVKDQHVVEPIMLDGRPSYIWKMPPNVINWTLNPNKTGSLGEWWQNVKDYASDDRPTLPGEIGRLCGMFVVVEDLRCPTLTVGSSGGAWTITPGFVYPGNHDGRNNDAWSNDSGDPNYVFDVTTILGANALARYTRDELRMDLYEHTDYERIEGRGSYMGDGIQIPVYDKGTPDADTGIYRGSLVVPVSRATII